MNKLRIASVVGLLASLCSGFVGLMWITTLRPMSSCPLALAPCGNPAATSNWLSITHDGDVLFIASAGVFAASLGGLAYSFIRHPSIAKRGNGNVYPH